MMENINYSLCWEDYDLVLNSLSISERDTILCIASGGENLFSIALKNPKKIIGIDYNEAQIHLVKLKIAAIQTLNFYVFVNFFGFIRCNNRLYLFKKCSSRLDNDSKRFWLDNLDKIGRGIVHCGKLEKYLGVYRAFFLRLFLSSKKINRFLSSKGIDEQRRFYNQELNNLLWRLSFKLFFSQRIMQLLGRQKEFFQYNKKKNISDYFLIKTEKYMKNISVQNNPFIHIILKGTVPIPLQGHPYLDKSNFNKLKKIVGKIILIEDDISDYIKKMKKYTFTKYCLSDIFESVSQDEYEEIIKEIANKSRSGSVICYWNNLVKRNVHTKTNNFIRLDIDPTKNADRVFFYSDFIVEKLMKKS
ncbi:MAG: DUF3419 family protein [Nanoarchaeota archaeon]|nr:DUF3419 family protein [Nanoarchaeota archaeon]